MNCRYDNSMYTTNPPQTIVNLEYTEEEYFKETIREHNFEESYNKQHEDFIGNFDDVVLSELIKHEPKQITI